MRNNFDKAMNYIDAHVTESLDSINKGIQCFIGFSIKSFHECFYVLTGETLFHYISMRKIFFVAQELTNNKCKSICDIALEYGYSEQSALTRKIKAFWNVTPSQIREGLFVVPDNKYTLQKICTNESISTLTRTQKILQDLNNKGTLSPLNWQLYNTLESAPENYGFDIEMCYEIADFAEKLGVSPERFIVTCYYAKLEEELMDEQPFEDLGLGLSDKEKLCIIFDLESEEELQKICDHFECCFYDIDEKMVDMYRNNH